MGENAYIITYPISGGKLFNLVLSHHTKEKVYATQPNIPIQEFRDQYRDFDPRIKRIIDMVEGIVSPTIAPSSQLVKANAHNSLAGHLWLRVQWRLGRPLGKTSF